MNLTGRSAIESRELHKPSNPFCGMARAQAIPEQAIRRFCEAAGDRGAGPAQLRDRGSEAHDGRNRGPLRCSRPLLRDRVGCERDAKEAVRVALAFLRGAGPCVR